MLWTTGGRSVNSFVTMIKVFVGDRVAMSDAFEIEGELSALQAFSVIPFTDSQPDGLGYSNGWTVGPEENRRQDDSRSVSPSNSFVPFVPFVVL